MITSNIIAKGILKAITTLVIVALFLIFIFKIQTVIVYFVVAIILCLIANPVNDFLKRRLKFSNNLAVIVTLLLFLFLLIGLILLFVPLILSQGNNLSLLNAKSIENQILELYAQLSNYLEGYNINLKSLSSEANLSSKLNFNYLTNFFNSVLNAVSNFGIGLAAVLFISFFLLKDQIQFNQDFKDLIPNKHEDQILNSLDKIKFLLTRYFIGLLAQLSIVCILYLIVLLIFGVENAFVIAFLCALLNIIPYIGPLIASVLAVIFTMLSNIGSDFQSEILPTTIYVLIGFFVVQLIDNNLSSPYIFSKSVKSHPLEIFIVILIAGTLFGIVGMIIAVPLYTMLKVIAKEFFPRNKFVTLLTKDI